MKFLCGSESRFFEFMSGLTEKDKIAILAHNDLDGVSSAVIASKVIGKVNYSGFLGYEPGLYKKIVEELKKKKINKILCLDLVIDNSDVDIKEIEKFAEILVIDHHPIFKNIESDKTIFIKSESYYPAAAICYYLFSKIQEVPSWIAALGIVADKPDKYNEKNASEVFADFNLGEEKINLFELTDSIGLALIALRGQENIIYDILASSKEISDINVEKYTKEIKKEMQFYGDRFDKEKEIYRDLIIYSLNPKHHIASLLINKISCEYPDKTLVFIEDFEEVIKVSARRQDKKVDCNVLMRASISGISDSTAGGHVAASAARFPREYLSKFKENLIREYKKLSEKLK